MLKVNMNTQQYILDMTLDDDNKSPLIENCIRDYIFDKDIDKLKNQKNELDFYIHTPYLKKVYLQENGKLNYYRDPMIVARENIFARELILRTLYSLQSSRGRIDRGDLIKKANFFEKCCENAIDALVHREFIGNLGTHNMCGLTFAGYNFIEEKLLSPFSNKIFLIAACKDEIYGLIDRVYYPIVDELGYELIFQEKSEPKSSIHEDIWDYIENSKLIICDLSFKRPNCFIEYGYALAKNKQIILCVEESQGKSKDGYIKVPFDTQNQKYSFWRKEWLENDNFINNLNQFKKEIM